MVQNTAQHPAIHLEEINDLAIFEESTAKFFGSPHASKKMIVTDPVLAVQHEADAEQTLATAPHGSQEHLHTSEHTEDLCRQASSMPLPQIQELYHQQKGREEDLLCSGKDGLNIAHFAAKENRPDIILWLRDIGRVDVIGAVCEPSRYNAAHIAAQCNSTHVLEAIFRVAPQCLDAKARDGSKPINMADSVCKIVLFQFHNRMLRSRTV